MIQIYRVFVQNKTFDIAKGKLLVTCVKKDEITECCLPPSSFPSCNRREEGRNNHGQVIGPLPLHCNRAGEIANPFMTTSDIAADVSSSYKRNGELTQSSLYLSISMG
jgi:hypothetical protein